MCKKSVALTSQCISVFWREKGLKSSISLKLCALFKVRFTDSYWMDQSLLPLIRTTLTGLANQQITQVFSGLKLTVIYILASLTDYLRLIKSDDIML